MQGKRDGSPETARPAGRGALLILGLAGAALALAAALIAASLSLWVSGAAIRPDGNTGAQPSAKATPTGQAMAAVQETEPTAGPTPFIPGMPACPTPAPGAPLTPYPMDTPTPEPSSLPTATVVPAPASVFGLAWFHKPPTDGTSPQEIAAAHSYVHLTGLADIPYRNMLRQAGYKGPIYTYTVAYAVAGPGPYRSAAEQCDPSYEPNDNNLAWRKGDFCQYIHPHESWFLHNGAGDRIVENYMGQGRWAYLMNPAAPGWQAFSYSRAKAIRDQWGYDGLWLDNLDVDLGRAAGTAGNSDGTVREYADNAAFREAMRGWLSGLRAALGNYPVWANLTGGSLSPDSWDLYAPYLDGAMDESFAVQWLEGWRSPGDLEAQMARAEKWLAMGKGLVLVGQGERSDERRLTLTLASYLLVANDRAFFRYTRFDSFYRGLWLYPEYDTARSLGAPLGARREISPHLWRRDFTNGYVRVDTARSVGELVLK